MTFEAIVETCLQTPELMAEYRRLSGSGLGLDERSTIERMVDEATGHDPWEGEWEPFFRFVRDFVALPLSIAA